MTDPQGQPGPGHVTVAGNRQNAKRTLRVRMLQERHLSPGTVAAPLVVLTIYNRLGKYGFELAMTPQEALALADALRDAPWRPPDA